MRNGLHGYSALKRLSLNLQDFMNASSQYCIWLGLLEVISPAFKQVTKGASEAQQNQSGIVLNDEDHSHEARPRKKIDLAKLQLCYLSLF